MARWKAAMAAAVAFLAMREAAFAQDVYVRLEFAGSGLTAADQACIQGLMSGKFAGVAGLNFGTGPAPAGSIERVVTFKGENNPTLWGDSDKDKGTAQVFAGGFTPACGFATAARVCNGAAETAAHELGHLLCAVHLQNAPIANMVTYENGLKLTGNGLPYDLMTAGGLVPTGVLAADGRSFDVRNRENIKNAVRRLRRGEKWDLDAPNFCDRGLLKVVSGAYTGTSMLEGRPATDLRRLDVLVDVRGTITGSSLLEFGWMNVDGEFHSVAAGESQTEFELNPGVCVEFACAGAAGSHLEGLVFPFRQYGHVTQASDPRAASLAEIPPSSSTYYGRVTLQFDLGVPGLDPVEAMLETSHSSDADGFLLEVPALVPVVSPPALYVLIALLVGLGLTATLGRMARMTSAFPGGSRKDGQR